MKKAVPLFLILFSTLSLSQGEESVYEQEFQPPKWEVGFHPGLSLPASRTNELLSGSSHFQVSLERLFGARNGVGVELGSSSGHPQDGVIERDIDGDGIRESIPVEADNDVSASFAALFYRRGKVDDYGTRGTRWVRTYFHIGAGVYQTKVEAGNYRLSGLSSTGQVLEGQTHPYAADTDTNFGLNLGVGFGTLVFKVVRIGVDLRYHRMIKHDRDAEFFIPTGRFSVIF